MSDASKTREQLLEELRELRARPAVAVDLFLRQAPAIFWVVDAEWKIRFNAGAALSQLGQPPEQFLGLPLLELADSPEARKVLADAMRKAGEGETVACDTEWHRRFYQNIVAPFRDERGTIVGCAGLSLDITDRRIEEDRLAIQSEVLGVIAGPAPLPNVLETLAHAVEQQLKSSRCSILLLDEAGERLLHGAAPTLPTEYLRAIDGLRIGPSVGSCGAAAFLGTPVIVADVSTDPRWESARGLAAYFGLKACWSTPIQSRLGKVLGTFAVYPNEARGPEPRELSLVEAATQLAAIAIERRRAHESLRRSEELSRRILEAAPVGVVTVGIDGTIRHMNEQAQQILGWTPSSLPPSAVADYPWEAIWENGTPCSVEDYPVLKCLRTGERQPPATIGVRRQDGSIRWIVCSAVPLIGRAGDRPDGAVATFLDITERKALEEQLRQAQKLEAIGRLAGGIAHDFNNLLTGILGVAEGMIADLKPSDRCYDSVRDIKEAAERAAQLTSQLLAFSRKQIIVVRAIRLNGLLEDLEKWLRRLLREDIRLVLSLDPELGAIQADPIQVEQIVMNLAINARDAMPQGGELRIETRTVDGSDVSALQHSKGKGRRFVRLTVADDGVGLNDAAKRHLFEPFFTTKESGKGTGLGLATVYGIVTQNDGRIVLRDEPGPGTTFDIYFPQVYAEEDIVPEQRPVHVDGGTETILLVEDEAIVRKVAATILRKRGYRVLEATNGRDAIALAAVHADPIDLLLTDVIMPEMNGAQLAAMLQASQPNLKTLFMSGYTDDAVLRHGVLTNAISFLQKPFTNVALAEKIREVLDAPHDRVSP